MRLELPVADSAPTAEEKEEKEKAEEEEDDEEGQGGASAAKRYKVTVPAAGIPASDLHVTIEGIEHERTLTVGGHSQRTGRRLHTQLYSLPRDADAEHATAFSVDGLLTVSVPKQP